MSKIIDMTGAKINYLTVIERGPNTADGRAQWLCQCKCGNKKLIKGKDLRSGRVKSCGCLQKQRASEVNTINEVGNQYGFLTVLRRATKEEAPKSNQRNVFWVCSCLNCGNPYFIADAHSLRTGRLNSCGCLISKNETKIKQLLTKNNVSFETQKTFNNLLDKQKLSFDFYINNQYIIEFDGKQHFIQDSGWSNREKLEYTHNHDLIKNRYCFEHNIPLIRIPYNAEYTFEDLKLETTRFLLTPENEEKYYQKGE